jgi:dTDP-4-dehydrorhamnose reductase
MRVLLTGASGLLGTWLRRCARGDVVALTHERPVAGLATVDADLTIAASARRAVEEVAPDLVLHTASRMDEASIVDATGNLAATGVPMVLTSTDAVFSGDGRLRAEDDVADPVWDYGRWKVEAEAIAQSVPGSAIVRLPLLVSLDPPDATTASIAAAARQGRRLGWYDGEVRMPAWTAEVAAAIWAIAEHPDRVGIWHLMGAETLTRAELGGRMADLLEVPDPGDVVAAPAGSLRPRDLRLSDRRSRDEIGWAPTPIR